MKEISLIDKILILINIVLKNKIYIFVFIGMILLCLFLLKISKKKRNNKLFIFIYVITLGIILYINRVNIYKIYDYMMNNIFLSIYFPNLAIYLVAIIITNIIFFISITNNKTNNHIKKLNIIIYSIITFLFILILNIIKTNKLNVYEKLSVYSNKESLIIIELTSIIFFTWILYLTIYKIIIYFIKPRHLVKENIEKNIKIKKQLSKNYIEIEPPKVVKLDKIKLVQPIIDNKIREYEKLLTLDDYKLLLNILKEEKIKSSNIEASKEIKDKEQNKFLELEKLYEV